jgi:hypothetical protein
VGTAFGALLARVGGRVVAVDPTGCIGAEVGDLQMVAQLLVATGQAGGQLQGRHLVAFGVQEAALGQDLLQRKADGGHVRVVETRCHAAVCALDGAKAHGALVPHHLAHRGHGLGDRAAGLADHRQQAHARCDPLLAVRGLTAGDEEFDRTFDGDLLAVDGALHAQEVDGDVDRLLALEGHVFDLRGDAFEVAHGTRVELLAQRVVFVATGRTVSRWCRRDRRCVHRQHRAECGVGAVGGDALQAHAVGLQVQVGKVCEGVVGRDVDGLGDGRVDEGGHGRHHFDVRDGAHALRRDEGFGQGIGLAALRQVGTVGVVFDGVDAAGAVGHALLAVVGPGERGLDAVGGVVGKGQGDGAGGRDRQQVRVAQTVLADLLAQLFGQALGERAGVEVLVGVELQEGATLFGQLDRGAVGRIAQGGRNLRGHVATFGAVVAQAQHDQGVAQTQEAQADAALGGRFNALLLQRPDGGVQHVVEHAHGHGNALLEAGKVETGIGLEGVANVADEVDRTEVATTVGRQGLFAAGVGGFDGLAVGEVVFFVDAVEKQHTRLGEVVGGLHDGVPQVAGLDHLVHPQTVVALVGVGHFRVGLGAVHQFPIGVGGEGFHESLDNADRDVEVVQGAGCALGDDEVFDVGVRDVEHAHLRATAGTGGLDRLADLVEHLHEADRAGGARVGLLDPSALGPDGAEVVAHATASAHGFSGLRGGVHDADLVVGADHGIAHRLHETVDQGGGGVGQTGGGVDAPAHHHAEVTLGFVEGGFPLLLVLRGALDGGQTLGNAAAHVIDRGLSGLGVFLQQNVNGGLLRREREIGGVGHGKQRRGVERSLYAGSQQSNLQYALRADFGEQGEPDTGVRVCPECL